MPLFPPQYFRKTKSTHRIGTLAARPAAADVLEGTIYFASDTLVLYRSNGATWDVYSGASAASGASQPYLFDTREETEPEILTPLGTIFPTTDVWVDVPYVAGDYTASAGNWTVDAGDVVTYKYLTLNRSTMVVTFAFNTTSVSALCQELRFKLPLNKIARTTDILSAIRSYDNGADTIGFCGIVAANNYVRCWRNGFSNWAIAVNNTSVQGEVILELVV